MYYRGTSFKWVQGSCLIESKIGAHNSPEERRQGQYCYADAATAGAARGHKIQRVSNQSSPNRTVDQVLFQFAACQLREVRLYCFVEGHLSGTRSAGSLRSPLSIQLFDRTLADTMEESLQQTWLRTRTVAKMNVSWHCSCDLSQLGKFGSELTPLSIQCTTWNRLYSNSGNNWHLLCWWWMEPRCWIRLPTVTDRRGVGTLSWRNVTDTPVRTENKWLNGYTGKRVDVVGLVWFCMILYLSIPKVYCQRPRHMVPFGGYPNTHLACPKVRSTEQPWSQFPLLRWDENEGCKTISDLATDSDFSRHTTAICLWYLLPLGRYSLGGTSYNGLRLLTKGR